MLEGNLKKTTNMNKCKTCNIVCLYWCLW